MSEDQNAFRERLGLLVPINNLQAKQQEQLLATAELLSFRKRDCVFQQGDRDFFSYYLLAGELEMWSGDQLIKKVTGGEAASFQPLAQLQPRQMSAKALGNIQVLRIDRRLLDKFLSLGNDDLAAPPTIEVEEYETVGTLDWLTSMLQSELFARIPPSNIQRLIDTLESINVKTGEVIIRQGSAGDYYYIIQTGSCEVCRATRLGKEIRLAELGPGDTFGEEALVSNSKRNATVRMLSDGALGRLTQEHFIELISEPVLKSVGLDTAKGMVSAGARWVDVRFPEEHQANGLAGSLNLPLSFLRARLKELDLKGRYVAYCDTGGRSSAAAFLLTQEGYDVCYVGGGAIDELDRQQLPAAPSPPAPDPVPTPAAPSATAQRAAAMVDAEVNAQALAAEVAKARIQIAQAQRLIAEAATTKRNAETYVQQQLESERARISQEEAAVRAKLEEAQRLKVTLEQQHAAAAAEVTRQREAQAAHAEALQREIEGALQDKEARLEEVYRKQAQQLEQLQAAHAQERRTLDDTWQQIELESSMSRERLAAAERLEKDLLAREAQHSAKLAAREAELREALKTELAAERQRFEAEFAKSAAEIARARQEQLAAEAAKVAAADEAQKIIAEYQANQTRQAQELQQKLLLERQRIVAESERLEREIAATVAAKEAAVAARELAEQALTAARSRQASSQQTEQQLRGEIEALEARAAAATTELVDAVSAASLAASRQHENAQQLERTFQSENEISLLVKKELDEWVEEQERVQNSTAQREEMARMLKQTARIKARATTAKQAAEQRAFSLLDEIATTLEDP